jgi:hypothetical protein
VLFRSLIVIGALHEPSLDAAAGLDVPISC